MTRTFVALTPPDTALDALVALQRNLPAPRLVPAENMHLTLAFLGDLSDADLDELHLALSAIHARPFDLCVAGLDVFGGDTPRQVHATLRPSEPLIQLQASVLRAARRAGLTVAHRRFVPHITLARLPMLVDYAAIGRFVATRALLPGPEFAVGSFQMFASHLSDKGARYEVLADYPLIG